MSTEYVCLLFYDLPSVGAQQQADYRQFRRLLLQQGYYPLQESVYFCHRKSKNALLGLLESVRKVCPINSDVRALILSEKQFTQMYTLTGEMKLGQRMIDQSLKILEV